MGDDLGPWIFIGCLVSGFIAAGISKNRDGSFGRNLGWFVFGGLLGPLGIALAWCSATSGFYCDSCRKDVHPKATRCPHCQSQL
jgi:hypothetical protein